MEQDYTLNSLVKYIYHDTTLTQTLEIENALSEDRSLNEEYRKLKLGYLMLPKAQFHPDKNTINTILNYSEQTAISAA